MRMQILTLAAVLGFGTLVPTGAFAQSQTFQMMSNIAKTDSDTKLSPVRGFRAVVSPKRTAIKSAARNK